MEEEEMEHEMEEKSVFGWICFEPNTKILSTVLIKVNTKGKTPRARR